jgi:hypothetical protein
MTFLPDRPREFFEDLANFNSNDTSLRMSAKAKNIERLKDLKIENLWLVGANEKELSKILPLVNLKYLDLYQVLAKDLTILETQTTTETFILTWNTKTDKLWDFSKNTNLRTLEVTDFSKLNNLTQFSNAQQIENLTIGGGFNKPLKLLSLEPIALLTNLKSLSLTNLKLEDDTLKPLAKLTMLEKLEISNQFDVKEYAWLATRLTKTKCLHFNASRPVQISSNNVITKDTMVTGRRKPFLLSTTDKDQIEKYTADFERLKKELAE